MDYYFNGSNNNNSTDWSDSNNWWYGPGGSEGNAPVPSSGNVDDVIYFETDCNTNIPSDLSYNIVIQSGATFSINEISDVTQPGGYYFTVIGTLYVYTTFAGNSVTVNGGCFIYGNASFDGTSGGSITSSTVSVLGGQLTLYSYNIATTISVAATILFNYCTITTAPSQVSGASIIINSSTVSTNMTIISNVSLGLTSSVIASNYTITNNGTATVNDASGAGALVNNNVCTIINNGLTNATFTNNGTCTVNSGGILGSTVFTNNGTTNINGNISMNGSSVYTNNGTFNFGTLYSTAFKGRIFPQVPSSASWGSALL